MPLPQIAWQSTRHLHHAEHPPSARAAVPFECPLLRTMNSRKAHPALYERVCFRFDEEPYDFFVAVLDGLGERCVADL